MPLGDLFRVIRDTIHNEDNADQSKLASRLAEVLSRTFDLGFTAFGGPPVHFQILHQRFVEGRGGKTPWIDEQTYQELFAICQALPGPGSTKMLFCIVLIHAGFVCALIAFLIWSLPGAIGMYGLSLGVQHIGETLPLPVYALLSGLNASTVGIIALAGVQLAGKAIKDRLSRILIILGGCAGLCYNAIWYFPVLMLLGGLTAVVWDIWLRQQIGKFRARYRRRRLDPQIVVEETRGSESITLEELDPAGNTTQRRSMATSSKVPVTSNDEAGTEERSSAAIPSGDHLLVTDHTRRTTPESADMLRHATPIKVGLSIIVVFFATFIATLVSRGIIHTPPLALSLFANMYLAGTIIFGGGPVVIPLLREYVVQPGWVSSRDFLLGLAIIQAFPGPNFNFGVYLGALALLPARQPSVLGALLGYVGIFVPGIALAVGVQSIWRVLRTKPAMVSLLRGVNATAVGLIFTAVYRLWQIGYLTPQASAGQSLALEPWWVVVSAVTYAETAWFGVPPAVAIVFGAVLGLCWYGAVGR